MSCMSIFTIGFLQKQKYIYIYNNPTFFRCNLLQPYGFKRDLLPITIKQLLPKITSIPAFLQQNISSRLKQLTLISDTAHFLHKISNRHYVLMSIHVFYSDHTKAGKILKLKINHAHKAGIKAFEIIMTPELYYR